MNRSTENQENTIFLFFVALFILCAMIPAWYAARAGTINGALLVLAKFQLKAFVPFSSEAQTAWAHICNLDPAALTWERMEAVLSYTGKWIRWPYALFLGLLACASIFMGRIGGLVRRLNMESLLKNNAESFACLCPIVGRGKELLAPASYDNGNWKIARSPLQFAVEHGLLLEENGNVYAPEQVLRHGLGYAETPAYGHVRFDAEKARTAFVNQLGSVFGGFAGLTPGRKALAVAFATYANGDKQGCLGILNAVSRAYSEKDGKPVCPLLEQADFLSRVYISWQKHKAVADEQSVARHSAFELPWFMALLTRARKKGVLASSQFLWLRPLDRPLWYALHQCGGRAAWAEGFAVWAHFTAEEKAGKALTEPHVGQAVFALRSALDAQGWLADKPMPVKTNPDDGLKLKPVLVSEAGTEDERVLAEAEDDPEYDANEDPYIQNQLDVG
jgi:hypothetical protein